jgi:hypothetical protein
MCLHYPQQFTLASCKNISWRNHSLSLFVLCFIYLFIFSGTGVWTQGFVLAKQVLYLLSHISSPRSWSLILLMYFETEDLEEVASLSYRLPLKPQNLWRTNYFLLALVLCEIRLDIFRSCQDLFLGCQDLLFYGQVWWVTLTIPATSEAEIRRIEV